jgi:hypothetical protein
LGPYAGVTFVSFFRATGAMADNFSKNCLIDQFIFCFVKLELMASFVEWATTIVDEQQQEHVSFPSFVKEFELLDKDDAIKQYEELLESPRLK